MLGRMAETTGANGELTQVLSKESTLARTVFQRNTKKRYRCTHATSSFCSASATRQSHRQTQRRRSYLEALGATRIVRARLLQLVAISVAGATEQDRASVQRQLRVDTFWPAIRLGVQKGGGVNVKFPQRPDQKGGRALLIEFGPGRVDFAGGVSELVFLPPGTYRLQGEYKADLTSERGLQWSVTCAGASNPAGRASR